MSTHALKSTFSMAIRLGVFGSYDWRMRFAWIEFGPFLVGQAASVFMDYDVFPNVLDYQGPPGMILMRQGLGPHQVPNFRRMIPLWLWVLSSPTRTFNGKKTANLSSILGRESSQILIWIAMCRTCPTLPETSDTTTTTVMCRLRVFCDSISFSEAGDGDEFNELGYGGNLTGTWHPYAWCTGCSPKCTSCPTPMQKSRFLWQYAAGKGINRYFQDPNGLGLDGVFTPATGFELIDSQGWFVAYEQWWADNWASGLQLQRNACRCSGCVAG